MSKINIERIVRDIKTRSTSLTPIIEAVCNSIEAIGKSVVDGKIRIILKRDGSQDLGLESAPVKGEIIAVDIIDNGEGFTDENRESFDTFKSDHKLSSGGKGFGRFMFLKYFNRVTVESVYRKDEIYYKRTFTFGHADEIIEDETNDPLEGTEHQTGTTIHLSSIKVKDLDKGIDVIARKLVERLLSYFASDDPSIPTISIEEEDESEKCILNRYVGPTSDIQQIGDAMPIEVQGREHKYPFTVKVYKIYYSAITNKICLTANLREVTESSLHNFIPEFKETMSEVTPEGIQKNFMVKVYVHGDYLDENVITERDGFNFDKESESPLFELSEKMIYKEAAQVAKSFFSSDIEDRYKRKKADVEHYVFSQAPWNKTLLKDVDMDSIPVGISDFDLEMRFQKMKFDKEQKARIAIIKYMAKSQEEEDEVDVAQIEEDVNHILALVTESQKNDLAHYVCLRKKVIELYDELRKRIEGGKAHKESEMHNLFFPMIKTDREVDYENNNLWLLDERFNFTQYIASDKVISNVDHKEPDLALFYEESKFYRNGENIITSPIAIVEFKRPKRTNYPDTENPIMQALRYAKKILEGKYEMPDGIEKIDVDPNRTPVYVFIVCDITEKIKEFAHMTGSLTIAPDQEGFFGFIKDFNAYVEIKSYKKVITDAKMRNQIFFNKLGLS
ncbi:MAG: sensor histidine kinase [Bacteroidales bacterium]|nr:sensor histidine kinase [Bacteroidales bacterium]